jgi:ubiquinone/menaquinone biosynthesis C-methylase UbiE
MIGLQWQLAQDAARAYEQVIVPAVLIPSARCLVGRLAPAPGQAVLDVGCGTGAATRLLPPLVGPAGRVVGVDVNPAMLDVARRTAPEAEYQRADARSLPFPDESFDVVICAHTLQFLPGRADAATELLRVVRDAGGIGLTTWSGVERNPYWGNLIDAVDRTLGPGAATSLVQACSLDSANTLSTLLREAGATDVDVVEETLELDLGDLRQFIPRHLAATPMADPVRAGDDEVVERIVENVVRGLDPRGAGGTVLPFRHLLALARR